MVGVGNYISFFTLLLIDFADSAPELVPTLSAVFVWTFRGVLLWGALLLPNQSTCNSVFVAVATTAGRRGGGLARHSIIKEMGPPHRSDM